MAVTRYVFPDRAAIDSVAAAASSLPDMERAAREILRARDRPRRGAELTAEEAVRLGTVADQAVPRVRVMLREKAEEAAGMIRYDAENLRRIRGVTARIRAQVQV